MIRSRAHVAAVAVLLALASASSCKRNPTQGNGPKIEERLASPAEVLGGNAVHGRELVTKFECARCHGGLADEVKPEKACVGCHERIVTGKFQASPEAIAKWHPLVKDLRYAPSLEQAGRLRSSWLSSFLIKPHDVRPNLAMTMPRLEVNVEQARDIAAFFKSKPATPAGAKALSEHALAKGDVARGEALLASKGCIVCHRMTGSRSKLSPQQIPVTLPPEQLEKGLALAPDLRYARDRMSPAMIAAWITKPSAIDSNAAMPDLPITEQEARDLTTFIFTAPLDAVPQKQLARLPVLTRPVRFDEVNAKVFHRTCWHCHSEPDYAIGDGGPGMTGGFGFPPRGLDLSSFQGLMAGVFEEGSTQKRKSIAAPLKDGTPRLVAVLLARHAEENGADTGEVHGMPLGLPPLPAEDIQLVESWIAQGRPR